MSLETSQLLHLLDPDGESFMAFHFNDAGLKRAPTRPYGSVGAVGSAANLAASQRILYSRGEEPLTTEAATPTTGAYAPWSTGSMLPDAAIAAGLREYGKISVTEP